MQSVPNRIAEGRRARWVAIAAAFAVAACSAGAKPARPPGPATDADYLKSRRLMVPVEGVKPSRVPDSYHAKRSGGRIHRATDIRAKKGTPVVAADEGRVHKVGSNGYGGKTIYVIDGSGRYVYYYAHLDGYRRGLREGDRVKKGEVIGYVGTTGNAPGDYPHLHFQVARLGDPKRYWDGTPIDVRPWFVETGRATKH